MRSAMHCLAFPVVYVDSPEHADLALQSALLLGYALRRPVRPAVAALPTGGWCRLTVDGARVRRDLEEFVHKHSAAEKFIPLVEAVDRFYRLIEALVAGGTDAAWEATGLTGVQIVPATTVADAAPPVESARGTHLVWEPRAGADEPEAWAALIRRTGSRFGGLSLCGFADDRIAALLFVLPISRSICELSGEHLDMEMARERAWCGNASPAR